MFTSLCANILAKTKVPQKWDLQLNYYLCIYINIFQSSDYYHY